MKRTRCVVCGSPLYQEALYILQNFPGGGTQRLIDAGDFEKDTPVSKEIYQCSGCGLVQFADAPVSYYRDQTRAGERSKSLIELRKIQYRHFIETYHLTGKKIIEIGAGKGGFLRTLKDMSEYEVQEYGLENNEAFVQYAREQEHVNMIQGYLRDEHMRIEGAPFDAFLSFVYFQRLDEPNVVLRGVFNNLSDDGVGFVQVPALEHLLRGCGFYDIVNDHISYFDQNTLRFWLERNGFEIEEIGETAAVYNYAIVRKRKKI